MGGLFERNIDSLITFLIIWGTPTIFFLASLGDLLTLNIMKLLGIPLMIVAGITIVVDMWKDNKVKSILIPILILVLIAVTIG